MLNKIHHIAIICSDYDASKNFYTNFLGMDVLYEEYRTDRGSYKLDLGLNGAYVLELFSFQNPPKRLSWPEACGLRHLAFEVNNLEEVVEKFKYKGINVEPIRVDASSGKPFTFIYDPDNLPIELYQK